MDKFQHRDIAFTIKNSLICIGFLHSSILKIKLHQMKSCSAFHYYHILMTLLIAIEVSRISQKITTQSFESEVFLHCTYNTR